MKRFEVLFYDADNICIAQQTIEAKNYKAAASRAQTLEEMGWASVDRYEIEERD